MLIAAGLTLRVNIIFYWINGLQMNIKIKAIMASLALVFGLLSTSSASDLWISQSADKGFIGTSDSCVVITFVNGKTYAPNKAIKRDEAAKQFSWKARTSAEQKGCTDLKAAASYVKPKIWKVAINPRYPSNKTRPTKILVEISAGGYQVLGATAKVRATIGTACGRLIKKINSRYHYRVVTIDTKEFAVVCE